MTGDGGHHHRSSRRRGSASGNNGQSNSQEEASDKGATGHQSGRSSKSSSSSTKQRRPRSLGREEERKLRRERHKQRQAAAAAAAADPEGERHADTEVYAVIRTTKEDREKMRKVSKLGMMDPVDMMIQQAQERARQQQLNGEPSTGRSARSRNRRQELAAAKAGGFKPPSQLHLSIDEDEQVNTGLPEPSTRENNHGRERRRKSPMQRDVRRNKSTGSSDDLLPPVSTLFVGDTVDDEIEPQKPSSSRSNKTNTSNSGKKEKKSRSRSVDLDKEFFGGLDVPPAPFAVETSNIPASEQAEGNPLIRKVIAPTDESKQLMRQVSALGLEDPVFGNIHESTRPHHPSNIFEDMNYDDVPDDMKDIMSIASDKTDPMLHLGDSPNLAARFHESFDERDLFGGGSSKFHSDSKKSLGSTKSGSFDGGGAFVPPFLSATKPPSPARLSDTAKKSNLKSQQDTPVPEDYVPPTGSFRIKKSKGASSNPLHLSVSAGLAAPIASIDKGKTLRHSSGNLHNSLNFNLSGDWHNSNFQDGGNSTSKAKGERHFANPSSVYVPPQPLPTPITRSKSEQAGEGSRVLPSIEGIFTAAASRKKALHEVTPEKPSSKKKLPPTDSNRKMPRNSSTRSWDSDSGGSPDVVGQHMTWARSVSEQSFSSENKHDKRHKAKSPPERSPSASSNKDRKSRSSRRRRSEKGSMPSKSSKKKLQQQANGEGELEIQAADADWGDPPDSWFPENSAPVVS